MSEHIFIGVDGGASKCKVRIEDAQGRLLGQSIGGPANIRFSAEKAWNTINQAIDEILQSHNINLAQSNLHFHAGIGLAGCEVQEDREDFLSRTHHFKSLQLTSDAHIACIGAHHAQDGAIIIIGTGVVGYQIHDGTTSRVGGWGFPHDDEGGGAWLGLEAVRLTFKSLDGRLASSSMTEDIFNHFNRDLNHLTTWSVRATSTQFAQIAPFVIKHAEEKDSLAIKLLQQAAQAIDEVGLAMQKLQPGKPLPCSLIGGVAKFVEPYLGDALRERVVPLQQDPNYGAILMMKKAVGIL